MYAFKHLFMHTPAVTDSVHIVLTFGVVFLGSTKNIYGITERPIILCFFKTTSKLFFFFLSDKPHSPLWAALCLSSNLDSLFATPDNCGGTFLQSQPFAGMGQTFFKVV